MREAFGLILALYFFAGNRGASDKPPTQGGAGTPPPTPGGAGTPPPTPGGARKRYSRAQLQELIRAAGWPEDAIDRATRIALRESGGDPRAHLVVVKPKPGFLPEDSRGLFQINVLAWPQYAARDLYDGPTNARTALEIYRRAGWKPWRLSSEIER